MLRAPHAALRRQVRGVRATEAVSDAEIVSTRGNYFAPLTAARPTGSRKACGSLEIGRESESANGITYCVVSSSDHEIQDTGVLKRELTYVDRTAALTGA